MISELLQHTVAEPSRDKLDLLEELTVLVATDQVHALLDGRQRRTFKRIFSATTAEERAQWTVDDWTWKLRFAGTALGTAPMRLAKLHAKLSPRHDFPTLDSMREWGHPKWAGLVEEVGCDISLAGAITSLILEREELPGGPATRRMYIRLGFGAEDDGRPHRLAMFPEHLRQSKWRLQRVAHEVCARVVHPGPKPCVECPLKSFCESYRTVTRPRVEKSPSFVDVFAGGGGLSLGLTNAGLHLRLAVEKERHAADTLYLNHPEAPNGVVDARDIRELLQDPRKLAKLKGVDVVAGGPPCQPFSMARRHSKADRNDPRRFLFRSYIQMVKKLRPKIVILENVPGIQNAAGGDITEAIHAEFKEIGYAMEHRLLNAADYGVPQNRHRFFFIGVRRQSFDRPKKVLAAIFDRIDAAKIKSRVPARAALGGIPRFSAGQGGQVVRKSSRGRLSGYGRTMSDPGSELLFNHETRAHNPRDIEIFAELSWGETAEHLEARKPGIIPYQLESFSDKYRRLHPQRPAPTIPAHLHRDANSFVHFGVARGITGREAARFQSFPDSYVFLGGFGPSFIQIGNAVPPKLAQVVGESVKAALAGARPRARSASRVASDSGRLHAPRSRLLPTRRLPKAPARVYPVPSWRRASHARTASGSWGRRSATRRHARSSHGRKRPPARP